jgi:predicted Fe-Mo cluster-binding NifX family protein
VEQSKSSNRIALATVGDSVTSEISKKAGRSSYYLIFDDNGLFLKSLINPSQTRGRRASTGVVDLLIKESVRTVIAGKFGNKMKKLLETNNIEYHEHSGVAQDVVGTIVKNKRSKNDQK